MHWVGARGQDLLWVSMCLRLTLAPQCSHCRMTSGQDGLCSSSCHFSISSLHSGHRTIFSATDVRVGALMDRGLLPSEGVCDRASLPS